MLKCQKIVFFLERSADVDETTLLTEFVAWIREEVAPKMAKKSPKNGKHLEK